MEFIQFGQYVAAFAFVVGLIGLMGLGLRKYGNPATRSRKRSHARLEVVETLPIDARSRLMIIRRDDMEHLLVKSGDRFELIEADIPCALPEEDSSEPEEDNHLAVHKDGPRLLVNSNKERP